jgi:hypothetical protein
METQRVHDEPLVLHEVKLHLLHFLRFIRSKRE